MSYTITPTVHGNPTAVYTGKFLKEAKMNRFAPLTLQIPTQIDYFLARIKHNDYFSIARRQSEYWWVVREALRRTISELWPNEPIIMEPFLHLPGKRAGMGPGPEAFHPSLDVWLLENFVKNRAHAHQHIYEILAGHWEDAWDQNLSRGRKWTFSKKISCDLLKMVCEPKPPGFLFSVHDGACVQNHGEFPSLKYGHGRALKPYRAWTASLINSLIPSGEKPFLSTIWREWARTGEIDRIFQEFGHDPAYKIVVVGPPYFKNFAERANLKYYQHIQISHNKAALYAEEYFEKILSNHKTLIRHHDKILYLFTGGDAAVWLVQALHGKLDSSFMIEVGRALDVYYFYCKQTMEKYPAWQFGPWMKNSPPKWYLKRPKRHS